MPVASHFKVRRQAGIRVSLPPPDEIGGDRKARKPAPPSKCAASSPPPLFSSHMKKVQESDTQPPHCMPGAVEVVVSLTTDTGFPVPSAPEDSPCLPQCLPSPPAHIDFCHASGVVWCVCVW